MATTCAGVVIALCVGLLCPIPASAGESAPWPAGGGPDDIGRPAGEEPPRPWNAFETSWINGLFSIGVRYSALDLDDGAVRGGESSRLTGIFNWYLTARSLLAFNYGLIRLALDGVESHTQAFQMRLFLLF